MRIEKTRRYFVISAVLLSVLLTGCFQQAGSGARPQAVSQALPSPTEFIPPSPTPTEPEPVEPTPTEEEEIIVEQETEEPVPTIDFEEPLLLTTAEVEEPLGVTEEPQPTESPSPTATEPGLIFPTETPTLDFVFPTPFPTTTPMVVAQLEETPEPLMLTATAVRQFATETEAANQTATADALFPIATTEPPLIFPTDPGGDVIFATNTPGFVQPGADCVHEVRAGENLFRLSLQYGVTLDQLVQRNGIVNPSVILVGQRITIPGCGTTGVVPPPTSVGTPVPGTGGPIGGGRIHVVRQGETLFRISLQYGVTVEAIAAANGISNINLIFIGQQLTIP